MHQASEAGKRFSLLTFVLIGGAGRRTSERARRAKYPRRPRRVASERAQRAKYPRRPPARGVRTGSTREVPAPPPARGVRAGLFVRPAPGHAKGRDARPRGRASPVPPPPSDAESPPSSPTRTFSNLRGFPCARDFPFERALPNASVLPFKHGVDGPEERRTRVPAPLHNPPRRRKLRFHCVIISCVPCVSPPPLRPPGRHISAGRQIPAGRP